jgi:hypothetical protein
MQLALREQEPTEIQPGGELFLPEFPGIRSPANFFDLNFSDSGRWRTFSTCIFHEQVVRELF